MILTTSVYRLRKNGKKSATQAFMILPAEIRDMMGTENKVVNLIILKEDEYPTTKQLEEAIEKIKKVQEAEDMLKKVKRDLGL